MVRRAGRGGPSSPTPLNHPLSKTGETGEVAEVGTFKKVKQQRWADSGMKEKAGREASWWSSLKHRLLIKHLLRACHVSA